MATPTVFGTINELGIDPTQYYTVSASVTPETPAPPFQVGTLAYGNNGSEFLFVQASTSIGLGDFVAITNALQANSMTSTNVLSSLGARIGMASSNITRQSVTLIPAGAFFWAQLRGVAVPGNTVNGSPAGTLGAAVVQLYTSGTAGTITSTSAATAAGLQGIEVILSASASGLVPTYNLVMPRTVTVVSSTGGQLSAVTIV